MRYVITLSFSTGKLISFHGDLSSEPPSPFPPNPLWVIYLRSLHWTYLCIHAISNLLGIFKDEVVKETSEKIGCSLTKGDIYEISTLFSNINKTSTLHQQNINNSSTSKLKTSTINSLSMKTSSKHQPYINTSIFYQHPWQQNINSLSIPNDSWWNIYVG